MSAMGAVVGAAIGVSAGATVKQGKIVDPVTAANMVMSQLQADFLGGMMTMPYLGAVAGAYAGYYRMIPYVRDFY